MSPDVIGKRENEWQITRWLYKRFSKKCNGGWLASSLGVKKRGFPRGKLAVYFWFRHGDLRRGREWRTHRSSNGRSSEKFQGNIVLRQPSRLFLLRKMPYAIFKPRTTIRSNRLIKPCRRRSSERKIRSRFSDRWEEDSHLSWARGILNVASSVNWVWLTSVDIPMLGMHSWRDSRLNTVKSSLRWHGPPFVDSSPTMVDVLSVLAKVGWSDIDDTRRAATFQIIVFVCTIRHRRRRSNVSQKSSWKMSVGQY